MNNKKPRDPFSSDGFEKTKLDELLPKPKPKDDELSLLKKLQTELIVLIFLLF